MMGSSNFCITLHKQFKLESAPNEYQNIYQSLNKQCHIIDIFRCFLSSKFAVRYCALQAECGEQLTMQSTNEKALNFGWPEPSLDPSNVLHHLQPPPKTLHSLTYISPHVLIAFGFSSYPIAYTSSLTASHLAKRSSLAVCICMLEIFYPVPASRTEPVAPPTVTQTSLPVIQA